MAANPKRKKEIDEEFKSKLRNLPCIVCYAPPPSTVSHIRTRGAGGDDSAHNVVPKCMKCHRSWEDNKPAFLLRHPHFAEHLKRLGWQWWEFQNTFKMIHSKK